MITDIFQKRYPNCFNFPRGQVSGELHVFLRQGTQIIFQDLKFADLDLNALCYTAYTKLVRELGYGIYHGHSNNPEQICIGALCEQYDWRKQTHGIPELFVSTRFSLLELLFAEIEKTLYKPADFSKGFSVFKRRKPQRTNVDHEHRQKLFRAGNI